MPTSVINRRWLLDRDHIQGVISEHISGPIPLYTVCDIKDERGWDLLYDMIFLDPVTTHHVSQFLLMWPQHKSRSSPFREWWHAFRPYIVQMLTEPATK